MQGVRGFVLSVTVGIMLTAPSIALAVCRVVEPVSDSGVDPVQFDPTTVVVYFVVPDQVIDYSCEPFTSPAEPAVEPVDSDTEPEDGSPTDPDSVAIGSIMDGDGDLALTTPSLDETDDESEQGETDGYVVGLTPEESFGPESESEPAPLCDPGFEPVPVLGTLTHMVIRPSVYASGGSAGLVMPLPQRADVHVAPDGVIEAVGGLMAAEVMETVEFVEDRSLGWQCGDPHYSSDARDPSAFDAPLSMYGCSEMASDDAAGDYYRPGLDDYETETVAYPGGGEGSGSVLDSEESSGGVVQLERISTTQDYTVTVLSASSIDALARWMDDNSFAHDAVDDEAFSAYVTEGAWFLAINVHPQDLGGEHVALAPLVVSWQAEEIPVQNRLTYDPDGGSLINDMFIVAPTRMLDSTDDGQLLYSAPATPSLDARLQGFGLEDAWLTRLEMTRRAHIKADDTAIVAMPTSTTQRPVLERTLRVRVAAACCSGNSTPRPGSERTFIEERDYAEGNAPADESLFYQAPAPESSYCPGSAAYDGWYEEEYGYAPAYASGAYGRDDYDGGGAYFACSQRGTMQQMSRLFTWGAVVAGLFLYGRTRRRSRSRSAV